MAISAEKLGGWIADAREAAAVFGHQVLVRNPGEEFQPTTLHLTTDPNLAVPIKPVGLGEERMTTYSSVRDYFAERHPILVERLDDESLFWSSIRDNSVSNEKLKELLKLGGLGLSARAMRALLWARQNGDLPNPEELNDGN